MTRLSRAALPALVFAALAAGLVWATDPKPQGSSSGATGTASGDLSGTYPSPTVAKLQGTAVSSTAPTNGQVLAYSSGSSSWVPSAGSSVTNLQSAYDGGRTITTASAGTPVAITGAGSGSALTVVSGTISSPGAGASSERFGSGSVAGGAHGVVVGEGATDSSVDDQVVIGSSGTVGAGNFGVVVGNASAVTASGGTAVGGVAAAGDHATALGVSTSATGTDSVSVGRAAQSTALRSVAIGTSANASAARAVAIGYGAIASSADTCVIASGTQLLCATSTPTAGKVATFAGDVKVTGILDPTALDLTDGTGVAVAPSGSARLVYIPGTGVQASLTGGAYSTVVTAATIGTFGVSSITGTANQVNASASTGAVTLSLPQSIHTAATPTFAGLTLSGQTNAALGTAGAPAYSFTGDLNTGVFSSGADSLGLVTGGTARFTLSTSAMTTTLPLRGQAGTVSAPAVSFSSDTDTGLYNTANVLLFAAGGTAIANVSATGITVTSGAFTATGTGGAGTEKFGLSCDAGSPNSVALGYNSKTLGAQGGALVVGWGSTVNGLYATVHGSQSSATGDATTAVGGGAVVAGGQSTALGTGATTSTATYAVALGAYAVATGSGAIAIGGQTPTAAYTSSIAIGADAVASAANELRLGSATNFVATEVVVAGANAQGWTDGVATELLTLSTSGTTTDTSANLLPANSVIYAVTTYVTTTISGGGVASYSIGDSSSGTRFASAVTPITAGSTKVGLGAPASAQASAAKVRITASATPSAGAVRITVHYRTFTPPGS